MAYVMTNNSLYQALNELLAERCSIAPSVLDHHSKDESWHEGNQPVLVCYPKSSEEITKIIRLCQQAQVGITTFGAGTSVEGQSIPGNNCISLDLSFMNRIISIKSDDLLCKVEAGVTRIQLNDALRQSVDYRCMRSAFKLSQCLAETVADIEDSDLLAPIVGHVGDGNFHALIVLPENDDEAFDNAQAINQKMIERAVKLGGTCTGEHGIGLGKKQALQLQHGDTLPVMKAIKQALDPGNILNPGKLYD